jgi:hypothetical protein
MRPWVTALLGRELDEALNLSALRALVAVKPCLVLVALGEQAPEGPEVVLRLQPFEHALHRVGEVVVGFVAEYVARIADEVLGWQQRRAPALLTAL